MRVVRHPERLSRRLSPVVLTLGNFDGVHVGHRAILARARAEADRRNAIVATLTFHPHPVAVLAPERAPGMLQSLRDRLVDFRALGVDVAIAQRFSRRFAQLEPAGFVDDYVRASLDVVHVVVGHSVTFGRNRAGTAEMLADLGRTRGFAVERVGPVSVEGTAVSSSAIRGAVLAGDVGRAATLLGRPYRVRGRVVMGDCRGRTLGFPTANLHQRSTVVRPADGVYAVRVQVDGATRDGVMNIGQRPTFAGVRPTAEVHLLDWEGDLYGRWIAVDLVARLRGEQRFTGVEALRAAIAADVVRAREVLRPDAATRAS
jgi:riboflavin kinase/FMN adenylyltransferase